MDVAPRVATVEPYGIAVMTIPDMLAAERQFREEPPVPVTLTYAPVVPLPGATVAVAVGGGVVPDPEPEPSVRNWAETNPFCAAHTTGTQPLLAAPRVVSTVPSGTEVMIDAVESAAVRQRRLDPVPETVPVPV